MTRNSSRNIIVVLAGPRDSKNVGAVCRAMKNMGLLRLVISGERTFHVEDVKTLAVHAYDVFENAVFHNNLRDALRDVSFVAGITRRRGRLRKYFTLSPYTLAERLLAMKQGTAAVVFGNEEAGLSDEELALCNVAVRIPSSEKFPSLNLSHAVQVIAYEIYCAYEGERDGVFSPISSDRLDRLTGDVIGALKIIGFFKQVTPYDMSVFFRDIFARAMLDEKEAERIASIFRKIKGITGKKN